MGNTWVRNMGQKVQKAWTDSGIWFLKASNNVTMRLRDARGQGTVEYAILVGVLVVIAIIAVVTFRGKLQELWDSISSGINKL